MPLKELGVKCAQVEEKDKENKEAKSSPKPFKKKPWKPNVRKLLKQRNNKEFYTYVRDQKPLSFVEARQKAIERLQQQRKREKELEKQKNPLVPTSDERRRYRIIEEQKRQEEAAKEREEAVKMQEENEEDKKQKAIWQDWRHRQLNAARIQREKEIKGREWEIHFAQIVNGQKTIWGHDLPGEDKDTSSTSRKKKKHHLPSHLNTDPRKRWKEIEERISAILMQLNFRNSGVALRDIFFRELRQLWNERRDIRTKIYKADRIWVKSKLSVDNRKLMVSIVQDANKVLDPSGGSNYNRANMGAANYNIPATNYEQLYEEEFKLERDLEFKKQRDELTRAYSTPSLSRNNNLSRRNNRRNGRGKRAVRLNPLLRNSIYHESVQPRGRENILNGKTVNKNNHQGRKGSKGKKNNKNNNNNNKKKKKNHNNDKSSKKKNNKKKKKTSKRLCDMYMNGGRDLWGSSHYDKDRHFMDTRLPQPKVLRTRGPADQDQLRKLRGQNQDGLTDEDLYNLGLIKRDEWGNEIKLYSFRGGSGSGSGSGSSGVIKIRGKLRNNNNNNNNNNNKHSSSHTRPATAGSNLPSRRSSTASSLRPDSHYHRHRHRSSSSSSSSSSSRDQQIKDLKDELTKAGGSQRDMAMTLQAHWEDVNNDLKSDYGSENSDDDYADDPDFPGYSDLALLTDQPLYRAAESEMKFGTGLYKDQHQKITSIYYQKEAERIMRQQQAQFEQEALERQQQLEESNNNNNNNNNNHNNQFDQDNLQNLIHGAIRESIAGWDTNTDNNDTTMGTGLNISKYSLHHRYDPTNTPLPETYETDNWETNDNMINNNNTTTKSQIRSESEMTVENHTGVISTDEQMNQLISNRTLASGTTGRSHLTLPDQLPFKQY